MGFTTVDYAIVAIYLVGMAVLGILSGGKQHSIRDYFLGSKTIPWWAVCFAIVATETSTLTFISIPGVAYVGNLNFLQVTFGYLVGRVVVSIVLLPAYARGELSTAYQLLANRFGPAMRNVASATFMCTRVLADGVRLFATAIPLAILLKGWQTFTDVPNEHVYIISILVMAVMTLIYTFIGGVRAVIWTDVVQMFIYLAGAVGAMIVILNHLPATGVQIPGEKLSIVNTGFSLSLSEFFATPYTLAASILGGAFLSMASHGTDQLIVQRLLTVRTLRESRRALIGSGVVVIIQFALFLAIGLLLYLFYGAASVNSLGLMKADEIFPKFIIESMPSGLSGIIIAGLLAAAMSTLSGSVNSLASATINDLYKPYFGKGNTDRRDLFLSRMISLGWCTILVGVAIFFISNTSQALVELALSIASVTYGGLLGTFLLGTMFKRPAQQDAMIGFFAAIAVMTAIFYQASIAWTWFTLIGTCTTLTVGNLSTVLRGARR
jgi:SSS family transporter